MAIALILVFLALVFGPNIWVKYILKKHHKPREGMPGTGGELALHLIERFKLKGVTVKQGEVNEDH